MQHKQVFVTDKPIRPLSGQLKRVFDALQGGAWLTLPELHTITGDPLTSISAHIRTLRKPEGGSHTIRKRRRGNAASGLFEYKLIRAGGI